MGEHDEFIGDFLEECDENLDQFDQDLVALEENPRDEGKLKSVFRNIHTVKGSSGFFGYAKIGSLAHEGESLLGKLRDGEIEFTGEIATDFWRCPMRSAKFLSPSSRRNWRVKKTIPNCSIA